MGALLVSIGSILAAFVVHLVVWKIRLPQRQTRAIILIFMGTLLVSLLVLPHLAGFAPWLDLHAPIPLSTYLLIAGSVIAATLAYMITYSAIEVDSPSLIMVLAIDQSGADGLPMAEFDRTMNDDLMVEPRIRDLVRDAMAVQEGDVLRLTAKGEGMARMFKLHRRLLRAGMGG